MSYAGRVPLKIKCLGFQRPHLLGMRTGHCLFTDEERPQINIMHSAISGVESSLFLRWDPDGPAVPLGLCLIWGPGRFRAGVEETLHQIVPRPWLPQGFPGLHPGSESLLTFHWLERITWPRPERKTREWKIVNIWHYFCHRFKIRPYRMFCKADWQFLGRGTRAVRVFWLLNVSVCGLLHNPLGPDWLSKEGFFARRTFWNHIRIYLFKVQCWLGAALPLYAWAFWFH